MRSTSLERTLIDCIVRPQYAGGIKSVAHILPRAIGHISVVEVVRLLTQTKYAYPYHQSLGFILERAGMPLAELEPLRRIPMRFKFHLDYGMKQPAYDAAWKIHYPADLK